MNNVWNFDESIPIFGKHIYEMPIQLVWTHSPDLLISFDVSN